MLSFFYLLAYSVFLPVSVKRLAVSDVSSVWLGSNSTHSRQQSFIAHSVHGLSLWPARPFGTLYQIAWEISILAGTASDVCWRITWQYVPCLWSPNRQSHEGRGAVAVGVFSSAKGTATEGYVDHCGRMLGLEWTGWLWTWMDWSTRCIVHDLFLT